jgi:hypothetical protein
MSLIPFKYLLSSNHVFLEFLSYSQFLLPSHSILLIPLFLLIILLYSPFPLFLLCVCVFPMIHLRPLYK